MTTDKKVKRLCMRGFLLAIALILSYIEAVIPLLPSIPGVKLGLANLVVLLLLYLDTPKSALLVNLSRVILSGFLFGNMTTVLYALSGALVSFFAMFFLMKSRKFTAYGVSATGGLLHNMAQLCVAAFVLHSCSVFYYIPYLVLAGIITGLCNGFIFTKVGQQRSVIRLFTESDGMEI